MEKINFDLDTDKSPSELFPIMKDFQDTEAMRGLFLGFAMHEACEEDKSQCRLLEIICELLETMGPDQFQALADTLDTDAATYAVHKDAMATKVEGWMKSCMSYVSGQATTVQ